MCLCISDKFWTGIISSPEITSEDDVDAYFNEISECDSEVSDIA